MKSCLSTVGGGNVPLTCVAEAPISDFGDCPGGGAAWMAKRV